MPNNPAFLYGSPEPLPTAYILNAGAVNCLYENGVLRYLRVGGTEIVRMIYPAVRDTNWGTVKGRIQNETVEQHSDRFSIGYDWLINELGIQMECRITITGDAAGTIQFGFRGTALNTFLRNRVGLCLHHPISGIAGMPCTITHPDGSTTTAEFPNSIAPHQPFLDIRALQWRMEKGYSVRVDFDGDVFETEDQRNWTDGSFKTYGTPLHLPFPAEVPARTVIEQRITVSLIEVPNDGSASDESIKIVLREENWPMPRIGTCLTLTAEELQLADKIRKLTFTHGRAEVWLNTPDWADTLRRASHHADALGLPLALGCHFGENPEQQVRALLEVLHTLPHSPKALFLFQESQPVTTAILLQEVLPMLRQHLPACRLVAGTFTNFAEFNRNTMDVSAADAVSYAIQPQEHAFDLRSLTETLSAQADTVATANQLYPTKPVWVSPVTLRKRYNPYATNPASRLIAPEQQTDPRQPSLFLAGWTLGSLSALAASGASDITYYETVGLRGLLTTDRLFSVYHWLQKIADFAPERIKLVQVSDPLAVSALHLLRGKDYLLLLANHTNRPQEVQLSSPMNSRVTQVGTEGWEIVAGPKTIKSIALPEFGVISLYVKDEH
ncbi:hypothetical protein GCM10023189_05750 [Nibrella saemangeumensis]|uniref:Uncharacterized protein n=1 Tax=Nibrella saemangeumensis TaxID=1084526 RepID=A0ABP8MEL0_9BACT